MLPLHTAREYYSFTPPISLAFSRTHVPLEMSDRKQNQQLPFSDPNSVGYPVLNQCADATHTRPDITYLCAHFGCERCGLVYDNYPDAYEHHLTSAKHAVNRSNLSGLYGIREPPSITKRRVDVFLIPTPLLAASIRRQAIEDFDKRNVMYPNIPKIVVHGTSIVRASNSKKRRAGEIEVHPLIFIFFVGSYTVTDCCVIGE